jgi:hypothetical protein
MQLLHKLRYILTAINLTDNVKTLVLKEALEQLFHQGVISLTVYSLHNIYVIFWYRFFKAVLPLLTAN